MEIHGIANDRRAAELDSALGRLNDAVAATTAARQQLEQRLADREAAFRHAAERATSEQEAALQKFARRQAELEDALTRLNGEAVAERQAVSEERAQRQAEFDAELMQEVTKRQKLASALTDAAAALQTAEQQAAVERQAAAEHAAQIQKSVETAIGQEVALRLAVEEELAGTRAASEVVQLALLQQVAEMRHQEARLEERAAHQRAGWESAQAEGNLARQSLAASEEQIQRVECAHKEERATFDRARQAFEADLVQQRAEYAALQETLEQTRTTAREALERVAQDSAAECARLEALVAEREIQLQEQAAAGNRDSLAIAQLQEHLKAVGGELETTRRQRDALKTAADLVPQLHVQIRDIRLEHRRRFDSSPVSMCRCGRDSVITQVNRALASLLGYDTPEDLQNVDFAATILDSGEELQWIVDRCLASRSTESVETTWRRKDGTRIIVRVLAVATTTDSIDLTVQDVTTLRELEEKLRNSQRMEAVARYASEVAVNCDNLLRHVKEVGEQWLGRIDSDAARYQAELLLDEVTRAAGFLRQLGVYGNEQMNVPELVEVNKVLRDMEPVLKRVAGCNIELVLPKPSTPLNLDVEMERIERMLVNVAAYGRERMPLGGRLMIEVASVVVDRTFVAKYPNVRPGAHVLLTVNEVRGPIRPGFLAVHTQSSGANATGSASDNPGVDLGALQALINDCGGHLWMMAEPPGDMVLKIHLPRRMLDRLNPHVPAKRPGARWINRLPGTWH